MGPNWIHGTKDNPMLDLVKQTDTDIGSFDNMSYVFGESGNLFPVDEGEKYTTLMWAIIEDAFKHSNKLSADISAQESLYDFFLKKVVEKIPETEENWEEKRKIVLQVSEGWGAFVGSPITKQSLKFFWLEECIEGGVCLSWSELRPRQQTLTDPSCRKSVLRRNLQGNS